MIYSHLVDGRETPNMLDPLPTAKGFIILSRNGYVQSIMRDFSVAQAIKSFLNPDRTGCVIAHFFLWADMVFAEQKALESLRNKLLVVSPGGKVYPSLRATQSIILNHYLGENAALIAKVDDSHNNYVANLAIFKQIAQNYLILAGFQPFYQSHANGWLGKVQTYRAFCRESEPEPVTATLR